MNFKEYIAQSAQQINSEMVVFFEQWTQEVNEVNPKLLPLVKVFIENCHGGKRIRGTLVRLGYELGKRDSIVSLQNDIYQISAALEILHTAILGHDDIIDQSDLRRGKPTIFKQLGGDHYGISQTIALGDIGFFLATKLIADSNFKESKKNKALSFFSQAIIETGLGELLDVELPHLGKRQEKDVLTIHKLKTAYYTVLDPLQLGAILGGAKQNFLDNLVQFGENLGIAFQIQDDILGVFGDEKEIGKSVTSDIEEGKNTLLITQALKQGTKEQKELLNKYYGQGKVGNEGLEKVRKVFIDTGALDYSKNQALKYVTQAKKVIPKITKDIKMRSLLEQMADFLVSRTK